MGNLTISMAMFNTYVKFPEGSYAKGRHLKNWCLLSFYIVSPWGQPSSCDLEESEGKNPDVKRCTELPHNLTRVAVDTRKMEHILAFQKPNLEGPSFKTFQITHHGQPALACGAFMILIDC